MDDGQIWVGDLTEDIPVRPDWLATAREAPIETEIPIIDPHHHLWEGRASGTYMIDEMLADAAGNHVVATVHVECAAHYDLDAPDWMKPVGETRAIMKARADAIRATGAESKIAAAIVGFVDLARGSAVAEVIEAHLAAAGRRFVGIRHNTVWHSNRRLFRTGRPPKPRIQPDLFEQPGFLEAFALLPRYGLIFDAWLYHTQLDDVERLAARFPDQIIVVDHLGSPVCVGAPDAASDAFRQWRASLARLAHHANVRMKIGGFGMRVAGGGWEQRATAPDSKDLATAFQPWVSACVDALGPSRCMFESNFPVDKGSFGYTQLWNAYKRASAGYTPSERAALFHGTAARTYGLEISGLAV